MSIISNLSNLSVTVVNGATTHATGAILSSIQNAIGGGRGGGVKFYYSGTGGGSILQVAVKKVVSMAVSALKDEAVNAFNSLLGGKKNKDKDGYAWTQTELAKQNKESTQYGQITVDGGTVYALDDWGGISPDALMLAIKTDKVITITQNFPVYGNQFSMGEGSTYKVGTSGNSKKDTYRKAMTKVNVVSGKNVVWYDTTALITINSDKNIVVTRVQGRDYSRKELVSNGDIKFSVTGQITSGKPDIYPEEEIKKFIKVMQYKGIVKINNQVLNQFGIENIIITDFNISPREGFKGLQNYTFNAIGLQPESETDVTEDTVTITAQKEVEASEESGWKKMLNNQLDGLKSAASDAFSQSAALATGILDNSL